MAMRRVPLNSWSWLMTGVSWSDIDAPEGAGGSRWHQRGLSRGAAEQPCRHPALSTPRIRTNRHSPRVLSAPRWARRRHRAEARSSATLANENFMNSTGHETARRRTFAIISHPDAGKTTLTEKLLLFGGAIQTAGAVKSNKIKKYATSDFMEIERQRGISVASSVMQFEYDGYQINLLDTPGHEDFS